MRIELLWFEDCPNHETSEATLRDVLAELGVDQSITRIEVPDLETGERVRFPGSSTIRIDGADVEPGWEDCEDFTPLYLTGDGLRGVPERQWVEDTVKAALTA